MFNQKKENTNPFSEQKENENIKEQEEQEIALSEENEAIEAKQENETNEPKEEKSKEELLKEELADINNKYLRMAADFDNYRKRQMTERENLIKYGAEDTLKKIIPVLDTFERAIKSIEKTEDTQTVKTSYNVCIKQLHDVLDKIGLKKIEAQGKPFDPNTMEAVMQTPTDEMESHTVMTELQAGYQLHDRVLRPVMVNVAVEKEKTDEETKE